MSCLSSCYLLVILFLIGTVLLIRYGTEWAFETQKEPIVKSNDKEVAGRIFIVSDTESDWQTFERFVLFLGTSDSKPDAIIHLGDITSLGVKDDFREFKDLVDRTSIDFHFVPGDRDLWKSSGPDNFKATLGTNYKVFTLLGQQILLIDNSNEYEGIDEEQFKFIDEHLGSSDFVFLHNPIFFNNSVLGMMRKGMGQYSSDVEGQRLELLSKIRASNVKATFAGDQHFFSSTPDDGSDALVHFIIGALTIDRNLEAPNYGALNIYVDGTYDVEQVFLE